MIVSGCTGIFLACFCSRFNTPAYKTLRSVTFFSLGLVGLVPFIHAVVKYGVNLQPGARRGPELMMLGQLDETASLIGLNWLAIEISFYLTDVVL